MHAPQSFAEWHYALPGGPCCGSCCSSPAQATPEAALAATAAKVSTSGWCLPKFHQLSQAVLMSWHRLLVAGGRSGRGSQSLRLTAAVAVAVAAGLSLLQAAAAPLHPGHRSDRHYFPANQQHHGCHLPRPLQLRAGQCTASAAMPTACLRGLCKRHAASVKAAKSPTPPWPRICLLPCPVTACRSKHSARLRVSTQSRPHRTGLLKCSYAAQQVARNARASLTMPAQRPSHPVSEVAWECLRGALVEQLLR